MILLLSLFISSVVHASEPVFCSIEYFKKHELKTNAPKTKRLHSFQIGKLELNGLAVGGSDAVEVAKFSKAPASKKHCTWYLNSGNDLAEKVFHHEHLMGPYMSWLPWVSSKDVADSYEVSLNPHLPAILNCAEEHEYFALGCDGQKHRGPSAFAWFLSIAGCEPKTSTAIANHFWALNGVPEHTREAIASRGYQLGNNFPEYRRRFQAVME